MYSCKTEETNNAAEHVQTSLCDRPRSRPLEALVGSLVVLVEGMSCAAPVVVVVAFPVELMHCSRNSWADFGIFIEGGTAASNFSQTGLSPPLYMQLICSSAAHTIRMRRSMPALPKKPSNNAEIGLHISGHAMKHSGATFVTLAKIGVMVMCAHGELVAAVWALSPTFD